MIDVALSLTYTKVKSKYIAECQEGTQKNVSVCGSRRAVERGGGGVQPRRGRAALDAGRSGSSGCNSTVILQGTEQGDDL